MSNIKSVTLTIMLIILVQLFRVVEFVLKVVLLFKGHYIYTHNPFWQQVKDGENIICKHTKFIKGKLYIKFVLSTLQLNYTVLYFRASPMRCTVHIVLEFEFFFTIYYGTGQLSEIWFRQSHHFLEAVTQTLML